VRQAAEVGHPAALPQERVQRAALARRAGADHLPAVVDPDGAARPAAEGAEVGDPAALPQERVLAALTRRARADDLGRDR
jgi:hypothetical protein